MRNSSRRTQHALRGAVAALALATLIGTARAGDWPQQRGDAQRTGVSQETIAPPLTLLWRFTGGFQNQNTAAPVIAGDTAIFATKIGAQQGGVLYAVDTRTGEKKWSFPKENTARDNGLTGGNIFAVTPTIVGNKVYAGATDGSMYVLDATTGEEIIRYNTGRRISSSALVEENVLYFGSESGTLFALNPDTGEVASGWRKFEARDGITSAPLLADTMLIVMTADNAIHGIKRATGIHKWSYRLPYGTTPNSLTYGDGSLYIPSGRHLFAIQPVSGAIRWQTELPEDIVAPPVTNQGVVYVTCRSEDGTGARLYAIKSSNGRGYWKEPTELPNAPTAAPVITGDILYFAASRGSILGVARETGKVLWQYRMEASSNKPAVSTANFQGQTAPVNPLREVTVAAPLSVANGTLYVVSNDGTLSAFRADAPDSSGPVATEQFPRPGSTVGGKPPFIAAVRFADLGSGVDPDSIEGLLDNQPVVVTFDKVKNWIYFATQPTGKFVDPPLANGRHTVTFKAKDFKGNETESTWSFLVDNSLPSILKSAPVAPKRQTAPATPPPTPPARRGSRL